MRTLYLDTTSSFLYCGVISDNELTCEYKKNLEKDLSTFALEKISTMFKENNIDKDSIDKIIVVNGPGSFTGIRIGLTIAKTWAWSKNIPIIQIPSLLSMALSSKEETDFVIPLIDARRGYVYAGIYDNNYNEVMKLQYIKLETLKAATEKLGESISYISNDYFDFKTEKYDPDILKIVRNCIAFEPINPHLVDAAYLKETEAEGKLNDN